MTLVAVKAIMNLRVPQNGGNFLTGRETVSVLRRRQLRGGNVTILWNQQVQTDRTIPNNKPGIIIRDN
jgi:hypothetical protein